MLYQVSFSALLTETGEEAKQVKKVAYVAADSTTEASANLIKVLGDSRKDLNLSSITINAISSSPVKEVYFDKSKEDVFFKVRVGFKDDVTKKFKYVHWLVQANTLFNAIDKTEQAAKSETADFEVYNGTITENIVVPELVGDYAVE